MKTTIMTIALSTAFLVPPTYADTPIGQFDQALNASSKYGIKQYKELESDDDGKVEIEGWVDNEWYAEIEVSDKGEIIHEKRERRIDGAWGMEEADVRRVIEAAETEGMTTIDEISISSTGVIEVEGEDSEGRDKELKKDKGEIMAKNS